MKNIFCCFVAIFLLLSISSCGGDGSTSTQAANNTSVTLVADKTQVIADGSDGVALTATVKDASGAPLAYQVVSFALSPPFKKVISPVHFTDENGQFHFFLRPSLLLPLGIPSAITQADITATCLGVTSSPVTITINPKPAPVTSSVTLVSDKLQAIADGRDAITFTATVKDTNDNPISHQIINFTFPPGTGPYIISPRYTDGNGIAVIHLTYPTTTLDDKVINVTATSGGLTSNVVTATYSAPPQVAPALVTLTSDKTTLIIDGTDQIYFTITATDSAANPLAGQVYHLNIPPGPYMSLIQKMTNTAGQAFTTFHSILRLPVFTSPTVISVTATINGTTSNALSITLTPP